jgi:hypothetical protein
MKTADTIASRLTRLARDCGTMGTYGHSNIGREYAAARERGDFDIAGVIAGEACALIHDIPPAGEIIDRIAAEAEHVIRSHAAALS